jgi:hypothetical protein
VPCDGPGGGWGVVLRPLCLAACVVVERVEERVGEYERKVVKASKGLVSEHSTAAGCRGPQS